MWAGEVRGVLEKGTADSPGTDMGWAPPWLPVHWQLGLGGRRLQAPSSNPLVIKRRVLMGRWLAPSTCGCAIKLFRQGQGHRHLSPHRTPRVHLQPIFKLLASFVVFSQIL